MDSNDDCPNLLLQFLQIRFGMHVDLKEVLIISKMEIGTPD